MRPPYEEYATAARARRAGLYAGALGALWFLAVSAVSYLHGGSDAFDLGYYLQALHAISLGNLNPSPAMLPGHTYLADNLALYLYPLALLFRFVPSVWLLLTAQAVWLGAVVGTVIHYAVRLRLPRPVLYCLGIAMLMLPAAVGVVWSTFHFDEFGGLLGALAALSLDQGRLRRAWLLAGLALLVKEDAGIVLLAAGLWHSFTPRATGISRRHAAAMAAIGALSVAVLGALVMPRLSPHHAASMAMQLFYARPGILNELHQAVHGLLWPRKAVYLVQLLLPLGLLPLLVPRRLPALLAAVLLNLIVLDPAFFSGSLQYNGYVLPFLGLAAVEGLERLSRLRLSGTLLALILSVGVIVGQAIYSWPVALFLTTVSTPTMPSGLAHLVPASAKGPVLTTNGLLVYVDPGYAASLISLTDSASFLADLARYTRYPTVALLRNSPQTPVGQLQALFESEGYAIVSEDRMAVVLSRKGPAQAVQLASPAQSATYPTWRPVSVGLETTVRTSPGLLRIEVRLGGGGIARLCGGSGAATTCTLYEPAWQGRTLQLVTYTKSGSVRLRIWEIPGTGEIRPMGPTELSALRYGPATNH